MLKNRTPEQHAQFVYGQPMKPCAKCGSWKFKPQMPIVIDDDLSDKNGKQIVQVWTKAQREGPALQGQVYFMCFSCFHKSPKIETGLSYDQAHASKDLFQQMKDVWNNDPARD